MDGRRRLGICFFTFGENTPSRPDQYWGIAFDYAGLQGRRQSSSTARALVSDQGLPSDEFSCSALKR